MLVRLSYKINRTTMSRKFTINNNKNFKKIGYFIKKNYLNSNDEKKLFKSLEKMKFEQISQKKKISLFSCF